MNSDNRSTVTYRSNLQPVRESCLDDYNFLTAIRDPFALEALKKVAFGYRFTPIQEEEYKKASLHCKYADDGDYPWGTVRLSDGAEKVICKCININCKHFSSCRFDFNKDELLVLDENQKESVKAISFMASTISEVDIFEANKIEGVDQNSKIDKTTIGMDAVTDLEKYELFDPDIIEFSTDKESPNVPIKIKYEQHKNQDTEINFSSFADASQNEVIFKSLDERTIINAGPGTGKTWVLIEKLINMIENGIDPEGILVLCFSRAAVEVIQQRLLVAVEEGRIGYDWSRLEIRTFDSFATYMIAWVQESYQELLPKNYSLESQDYDARIRTATALLHDKSDMFEQYEHIIVDEVQDLVGCRAEFVLQILAVLPNSCGFTLLGDACQALYDWQANNDPSIISSELFYKKLFKLFPIANYLSFAENHRQKGILSNIAIPYREAILTGTSNDRQKVVRKIHASISTSDIDLPHISLSEINQYTQTGTLGILTRTNGQALKISSWLKNASIGHTLQKPLTSTYLSDWIVRTLISYPHETINDELFVQEFRAQHPDIDCSLAKAYWNALESTQYDLKSRYEVENLLRGLLANAKDKMLFAPMGTSEKVVVSNIHRAKGREFDTVLVHDEVLAGMSKDESDDIQEHKVCYVALTRPKKYLLRAQIPSKHKYIYIEKGLNRRCFEAGGFSRRYLSHIEIGSAGDLDKNSFAISERTQKYIQNHLKPDTRLRLKKCPQDQCHYVLYQIVLEDDESIVLGSTGEQFAQSVNRAIQRIYEVPYDIYYKFYPDSFSDIYVDNLITCISAMGSHLLGAKKIGNFGIWMGFTVSGYAHGETDRY